MTDEFDPGAGRIAVVGIAGRFPGAADVHELWENLRAGKETVTHMRAEEVDSTVAPAMRADENYVRARGMLENIEGVDAELFRLRPLEARVMDPQQRVLLEICWEALESAGYDQSRYEGSIGIYASASSSSYFANHLATNPDVCSSAGDVAVRIGNDIDYIASSIAYRLNLNGPAVALRTACSSSLVAVAHACQALADFQCDMVLAGGVSVNTPQMSGYLHQVGGILSSDGHCRTFDKSADGTYFSNGAGVVLLKRLDDAIRDKDEILAVIAGYAVNNDGADRVSFTAPNVRGQAEVIAMAQELAGIEPESVSYVEAHGTATEVGDPIEVEALTTAFRRATDARSFCGIGSIKSNFGHLDVAAGVAGLIKTVLSVHHRYLPPSINFTSPNPGIDFENSPFYVVTEGREWVSDKWPLRAGVSSFGTGGTNAHVVVEEAPAAAPAAAHEGEELLLLSARTPTALQSATENLAAFLENPPRRNLADVAHTLRQGRRQLEHRRFVVTAGPEAAEVLRKLPSRRAGTGVDIAGAGLLVQMFPGQGTQYPGMGAGLYRSEPVYRSEVDRCLEILEPLLGKEMREVLFPGDATAESSAERLKSTAYAQPAIFLVEYALARLWEHRGVRPDAMIGHSIGEFVAATLAGIFSLEDALRMVAVRGQLMQAQPPGSMLSVRAPKESLIDLLPDDVSLACINGPALCVASGPTASVSALQKTLEAATVPCRMLHTSHAFHSAMMDPVVDVFLSELEKIELKAPGLRIMSTVTADWLTEQESTSAMYWARHLRETVRFADGIRRLLEEDARIFLECGARTTLSTLARQQFSPEKRTVAVPAMGEVEDADAERTASLRAAGELWANGVELQWTNVGGLATEARRTSLPTYPFERKKYWVDAAPAPSVQPQPQPQAEATTFEDEAEGNDKTMTHNLSRADHLVKVILDLLTETSGTDLRDADPSMTFLEMGFDSLFLTQVSGKLGKQTGVSISFRQMLEDWLSPRELAEHLDSVLPPDVLQPEPPKVSTAGAPAGSPAASPAIAAMPAAASASAVDGTLQKLVADQLEIMRQQLALMENIGRPHESGARAAAPPRAEAPGKARSAAAADGSKAFGPAARVNRSRAEPLTEEQDRFLQALCSRYVSRTAKSKASTQQNRRALADPRTVSGFHPLWKEIVYPVISTGSSGSRIFDVDGNEYIDVTNGFGTILLGHSPDFVVEAIERQLRSGYETGPQTGLAGRAAELVAELTGHERVAFTNTGSEAVLAAMRVARTCTGKEKIAVFSGSYHGIFDEVLVRGSSGSTAIPAAPGIPMSAAENVLVLDYGSDASLEAIERESGNLAAVLVESIQGGNASYQPVEFLKSLRELTRSKDVALIFDEVVTGFRVHPAGAQGLFDIKADIASYGKVAGGGMPIGIVAGDARFMDALDGGFWQFGDESRPEANMTFFAGTFVRHPLALAACVAVLEHLKKEGPGLQRDLNERAGRFAKRLNALFERCGVPMHLNSFSSFGRIETDPELKYAGLLYFLLREKGIHIWEGRAVILTTAHSDADLDRVLAAFEESIQELQSVGLLPAAGPRAAAAERTTSVKRPATAAGNGAPVPGAQLGRTPDGFPAWFVADPERPGKYVQIGEPLVES